MIDKERTINKAKAKFKAIHPAVGKSTLEECFLSLHGEIFFLFRTKDNKSHTLRALEPKRKLAVQSIQWGLIVAPVKEFATQPVGNSPVLKWMTQPVSIRPVIKAMTRPIRVSDVFRGHQVSD